MLVDEIRQVRDLLKKDLAYLHNDDFKGHCLKCHEPIMVNVVQYQKNDLKYYYHPGKCFNCELCGVSIEGKAFYEYNNGNICHNCYQMEVLGSCSACGNVLDNQMVVKIGEKQYHPDCFRCTNCQNPITDTFITKDDKVYCQNCNSRELPTCQRCKKTIHADLHQDKITVVEWGEGKYHRILLLT